MSLGTEVGLGPGNIVLDGDPASPMERDTAAPTFRPVFVVAKHGPISATAELLFLVGVSALTPLFELDEGCPVCNKPAAVVHSLVFSPR